MQATKRARGFKRKCPSDFTYEVDKDFSDMYDDDDEEEIGFHSDQSQDWETG